MSYQSIFGLGINREHLKYYRFALIIMAVCFPIVGLIINLIDPKTYDPITYRLAFLLITIGVFSGTFQDWFLKKFHVYFGAYMFLIILWTGFLTYVNQFSFSSTFFYIAVVSIISFTMRNYKEVALLSFLTFITTFLLLFVSKMPLINKFTIILSVSFIQFIAYIIVRVKNRSEIQLIESELKFQRIVEMLGEGVGLVNEEENFVFANSTAEKIFEVAPGELIGMNLSKFLNDEGFKSIKTQTEIRKQKIQNSYDLEITTAKGNKKSIIVTATPHFDNHDVFVGTYGVFREITERKHAEEKIQQQNLELQKLNTDKDRFIAILAHDLKNPFNSILGFLDLLTRNVRKYDINQIENQLNIVNQSAKSTFDLLENILLWVRAQSGRLPFDPQKHNLKQICRNTVENMNLLAKNKNITITNFANTDIFVSVDINMINTVLRNLITNAVKFTNPDGKIIIYAEEDQENVIVSIVDNGIGIESEKLSKLFDVTSRTSTEGTLKESGTGLGLLLCKEFIEKNGGKIWAESKIGSGSDFKFSLPLCKD